MSVSRTPRLQVVFCWHMHQPYYKGAGRRDYHLPWVYLHGIKDYADMAAHLENNPSAKAVVNFAPVLLEQLDDYERQLRAWLERGILIRDPLLAALAGPGLPVDLPARKQIVRACLRANENRLIHRFRHFEELAELARHALEHPHAVRYLNDRFLTDLLVWYHLAWLGECSRINDLRARSLQAKGQGYSNDDRRALVELIWETIKGLTPRYTRLAKQGRVELSVTPYAHPILPLLIDVQSAKEALPGIHMPGIEAYAGGEARARWHIRQGVEVFEKHFGFRPAGCWPSEGSVSEATVKMLEEEGFKWAASGQQVLSNSLMASHAEEPQPLPENWVHTPYRLQEGRLNVFFRDDGLSDLIGFTYGEWHADDAVADLINHLVNIAEACKDKPQAVVSIIMDGENAWEYYPNNGSYFLEAMYRKIAEHPRLQLTTFSEIQRRSRRLAPKLKRLVAGSWVYGTFTTWIGDKDKNRAWELLDQAKRDFDLAMKTHSYSAEREAELQRQLAICEGSDWFWWFGDYNPSSTVSDFEKLFRHQLSYLYELLEVPPPATLDKVFAVGSGEPSLGGVMRKND